MDLDDVARKVKEVSITTMFDAFIPGDDPPEEILAEAYFMTVSEISAKRKRSAHAPSHLKGHITDEICKISKSIVEAASGEHSQAPTIVTQHTPPGPASGRVGCNGSDNYAAGGVFLHAGCTTSESHVPLSAKAVQDETPTQRIGAFESWTDLVVPIEVKVEEWECAFTFREERDNHMRTTESGTHALERTVKHVGQLFTRHHRTHVYSLYVFRHQARILYFDRAYTLVSEPFKYGTRQDITLHTFFWRIARMSREQLGFDRTVSPANPENVRSMLAYAPDAPSDYVEEQIYHALSVDSKDPAIVTSSRWPAYELTMCGRRYVVGRPMFSKPSLHGRCTQGFLAYEIESRTVRFIKDCWRPDFHGARPEHEVYKQLNDADAENVLTCLGYEDVRSSGGSWQVTRTQKAVNRSCAPTFGHYRLLIKEVCRPLTDFHNFKEFTLIMCDAIIAHRDAWEKAGILHHDVSVNNILIYEDGRGKVEQLGILCDWDLCKDREQVERNQKKGMPDRTGTWPFRSALSLQFPGMPYMLSDDVESFIHVYHYCVLRFHETNVCNLASFVEYTYNAVRVRESDGAHIGGKNKLQQMLSSSPPMEVFHNHTLNQLLVDISLLCSQHYSTIDIACLRQTYDPQVQEPPLDLEEGHESRTARFVKRQSPQDMPKVQNATSKRSSVVPSGVAGEPLLHNLEALFDLFVRYTSGVKDETGKVVRWPKTNTKCADLFKGMRVASRKSNSFSLSYPSYDDAHSQDEAEQTTKKRKGSDRFSLSGLDSEESQEEEEEEEEEDEDEIEQQT